ncbi:MAG: choice-of-anchor D domain-containing protein, partial [bacterium]
MENLRRHRGFRYPFGISVVKSAVITLGIIGCFFSLWAQQHFQYEITDNNMSVLVMSATLDGEELVAGDEIGVFTPRGDCAGAEVITEDGFPIGIAAWGQEGNIPGFRAGEDLAFKVWDHQANEEWDAQITDVEEGEPVYEANGFVVLSLQAEREQIPDIEVSTESIDFGTIVVGIQSSEDFTVFNRGNAPLEVESFTITEGTPFSVNFEDGFVLGPGNSRVFTVTFAPEEVGEYEADLTIVSNDPDEGEVVISLS